MTGPREVLAVRYGTLRATKRELFHACESDDPYVLDYFFWVLRYDGATVLVDTGFDPAVAARRGRTCLCPPLEALAHLGVEEVERVIITHFHYDHVGNVRAFPEAELLVPARELEFWTGPDAAEFSGHVEADEVAWLARAGATSFAGGDEVASGVTALALPGHTPGQVGLLVEAAGGPLLLASDAVHFYEELEHRRPFWVFTDLEQMRASYDVLEAACERTGAVMVPGHDPEVAARFPAADGVAVRLTP
jgi:glyoxylase-like metal-dependent hydrolase (beta-lactamase superfamily II)